MKNSLADLNNTLFEQLDILCDETRSEKERKQDIDRAGVVVKIAAGITNIARTQLDAIRVMNDYEVLNVQMPALLQVKDSKKDIDYIGVKK